MWEISEETINWAWWENNSIATKERGNNEWNKDNIDGSKRLRDDIFL